MTIMGKDEMMNDVYDELVLFKDSPLYEYRTVNEYLPVIGEGSVDASIMLVGEAPGKNEAKTGKPFCGAAGKFLNILLESIGLSRDRVYITNIVKDRPPDNRDPTSEEIALYAPFLDRQIEIIKPKVIATLGRHSMRYIMNRYGLAEQLEPISMVHGRSFEASLRMAGDINHSLNIITLYHPAAALYNGGRGETVKKDFQVLRKFIE